MGGSDVSYSSLLVNTCSVYRPTVTYTKGRANKAYGAAVATGVRCNIQWHSGGTDTQHAREQGYTVIEGWFGFFEYGVDVQKDDRIVDEKGRSFIVKSVPVDVTGRKHHIESGLEIEE